MVNQIWHFLQPEQAITILVALSAFATVLTIAAPYLQGDRLRTRMKNVASERDRLRSAQRAALMAGEGRLRDKPNTGLANQIVNSLNLHQLLQAEGSRALLRQAGYRSERHLVTFLAIRAVAPLILALLVFLYSSTVFADRVSPSMRLVATAFGALAGFYLPNIFLKNMTQRRQDSIRRAWSDALDLLLICVESGMSIEAALQRVSREIGSHNDHQLFLFTRGKMHSGFEGSGSGKADRAQHHAHDGHSDACIAHCQRRTDHHQSSRTDTQHQRGSRAKNKCGTKGCLTHLQTMGVAVPETDKCCDTEACQRADPLPWHQQDSSCQNRQCKTLLDHRHRHGQLGGCEPQRQRAQEEQREHGPKSLAHHKSHGSDSQRHDDGGTTTTVYAIAPFSRKMATALATADARWPMAQ